MIFLADESVDQPIVNLLRSSGHADCAVGDSNAGLSDIEVLSWANDMGAILLTAGKTFGKLVSRQGRASRGVVLLRLAGVDALVKASIVRGVIDRHGPEPMKAICVVDRFSVQIRRSGS